MRLHKYVVALNNKHVLMHWVNNRCHGNIHEHFQTNAWLVVYKAARVQTDPCTSAYVPFIPLGCKAIEVHSHFHPLARYASLRATFPSAAPAGFTISARPFAILLMESSHDRTRCNYRVFFLDSCSQGTFFGRRWELRRLPVLRAKRYSGQGAQD